MGHAVLRRRGRTFLNQVYQRADAFLFGRRTYEIFAASWGTWDDPAEPNMYGLKLEAQVRCIDHAHRTGWANTTVLSDHLAAAIGELKAEPRVRYRCGSEP